MSSPASDCPFCRPAAERLFHVGPGVLGLWDAFPASPNHALLVPKRHVATWFDASPEERRELMEAVDVARARILERAKPDGWNVGFNVGSARGSDWRAEMEELRWRTWRRGRLG